MVWTLKLPMERTQTGPLVGELRSHMSHGIVQLGKKKKKKICIFKVPKKADGFSLVAQW